MLKSMSEVGGGCEISFAVERYDEVHKNAQCVFLVPQAWNSSDESTDKQATIAFARPQFWVAINCMSRPGQYRTLTIAAILTWAPWLVGLGVMYLNGRDFWHVMVLGES